MSRLSRLPFHKASHSTHLPSPPDTDSDFTAPNRGAQRQPLVPTSYPLASVDDPSEYFMPPPFELPNSRFKRPSLSYSSSGIREAREKTVQRSLRSFIVVIPPPSLSHEHGHLGPTLSSGPLHRLSQGILMPLFPTLYGQITAIAREFNFPSTAGLCLYLQWTDAGVTITPRISDESWPFLWSHEFDSSRPYLPGVPPISGRIEFDIDFQQARWYSSWVSSRDSTPIRSIPVSPPTDPPSRLHHRYTDSRTTTFEDELDDTSATRYAPKKLSLVDRFETSSIRSIPKVPIPIAPGTTPGQVLSPIPQAPEPPSAKIDLEKRVNTWRASASLKPTTLAVANGQTSLEPANLPNTLSLDPSLEDDLQSELCLEDFTWSISSVGPRDYFDGASIYSHERVPSVHLANRLEGSVCLTSPTCTSFGPSDFDEEYVEYATSIRVPTPDIAKRMWEDCPPTPSTATSWGPPLSYPTTPASTERQLSIDVAYRYLHSRPVTPTTATSWGPPSSYPSTPASSEYALSIDIAHRFLDSRPVTPTTATSWGPPSWPSSPALSDFRPPSIHIADRGDFSLPNTPLFGSWDASVSLTRGYPYFDLYPAVYPNFDLYPTVIEGAKSSPGVSARNISTPRRSGFEPVSQQTLGAPWSHVWPYNEKKRHYQAVACPWSHVWPYTEQNRHHQAAEVARPWHHVWPYTAQKHEQDDVVAAPVYPIFDLYPAVYPHFNLYPSPVQIEESLLSKAKSVWSPAVYPIFDLYPGVYPYNLSQIYRSKAVTQGVTNIRSSPPVEKCITVKLPTAYPTFDLYPSVYPYNLDHIYTFPTVRVEERSVSTKLPLRYPFFELYAPVYPHVQPYPLLQPQMDGPNGLPLNSSEVPCEPCTYPWFDLYPAVYPFNLDRIYTRPTIVVETRFVSVAITPRYPFIQLYSPVYSDVRPYPALSGQMDEAESIRSHEEREISMAVPTQYPFFKLYPPIYPHVTPYPSLPSKMETRPSAASRYGNRRTHAELHASVFINELIFRDNFHIQTRKTHTQQHEEVMITTSLPHLHILPIPNSPPLRRALPEVPIHRLPREPPSPQRKSRLPIPATPASPTRRLPAPPVPSNNQSHLVSPSRQRVPSSPNLDNAGATPAVKPRGLPSTPRLRSQASFDSSIGAVNQTPKRLSSLEGLQRSHSVPYTSPSHSHSHSIATPISPVPEQESNQPHRPQSTYTAFSRTPPKRKDSIVLQRVRAFNSNSINDENADSRASPSTTKLDQSRYSVFS